MNSNKDAGTSAAIGEPRGYSYLRFSDKRQEGGDSVRRQTEDTVAGESPASWCERNGVCFDRELTFRDPAVSAFRGKNAKQGELKAFLDAIKTKRVRRGDFLLVEKMDRISRQGIDEGYELCKEILKAGVSIVTLSPVRVFRPDCVKDLMKVMELQFLLQHAKDYSDNLSARIASNWEARRKAVRQGGEFLTLQPPAWIRARAVGDGEASGSGRKRRQGRDRDVGETFELVEERAAVVRRMFKLAIEGKGVAGIVRQLTREKVPPMGYAKTWNKTFVHKILTGRQVLGELQPYFRVYEEREDGTHRMKRVPDGPPISNYYPAVIDEATWLQAQAKVTGRRREAGRPASGRVNPFKGLMKQAGTHEKCMLRLQVLAGGRRYHTLTTQGATQGRSHCATFPFDTFERGICGLLKEVTPADLLPPSDEPADEREPFQEQVRTLEANLARLKAVLIEGDVAVVQAVREVERQLKDAEGHLKQANRRSADPLPNAWQDARTLLATLHHAADAGETRERLRGVLGRVVEDIWILTAGSGLKRYAFVQVDFRERVATRRYLLYHKPPFSDGKRSRPGLWWARSDSVGGGPGGRVVPIALGGRDLPGDMGEWTPAECDMVAARLPGWVDAAVEQSFQRATPQPAELDGIRRAKGLLTEFVWGEIPANAPAD